MEGEAKDGGRRSLELADSRSESNPSERLRRVTSELWMCIRAGKLWWIRRADSEQADSRASTMVVVNGGPERRVMLGEIRSGYWFPEASSRAEQGGKRRRKSEVGLWVEDPEQAKMEPSGEDGAERIFLCDSPERLDGDRAEHVDSKRVGAGVRSELCCRAGSTPRSEAKSPAFTER
ncbi:hypothetical protein Dimus_037442, partial [Dionaea muscipula]